MAAAKKTTTKPKTEDVVVEPTSEEVTEAQDTPATSEVQPPQEPVEVQEESTPEPTQEPPSVYGSPFGRRVQAKAVLYTDGISGGADMNHERAYEYAERLQTNDPAERATGDVSLSEAAQQLRAEKDKKEAEDVASGSRQ